MSSVESDGTAEPKLSAPIPRVGPVLDREAARGRLLHRIQLRAGDYLNAEIGWSRWIRWGWLMGLVEAGAVVGFWPEHMVRRVADAAWHRASARRIVAMLAKPPLTGGEGASRHEHGDR